MIATESESTILGAVLLHSERTLPLVSSLIVAGDFTSPMHRAIWAAIVDLEDKEEPIDVISVRQRMASLGGFIAGEDVLYELMGSVATVENIEWHANLVAQKSERARWGRIATELAALARSPVDDAEFFGGGEAMALQLSQQARGVKLMSAKQGLRALAVQTDARYSAYRSKQPAQAVHAGLQGVDSLSGGVGLGTMAVLAGRPGMGKSAFAMNVVDFAATQNTACLIFSLEMSGVALWGRLVQGRGVSGVGLKTGNMSTLDFAALSRASTDLSECPIWVDDVADSGDISIGNLRSRARRWVQREAKDYPIRLVVVDYLQLVKATGKGYESREREVAEVSRGLLAMAKELNVAVLALAQLNREVEKRASKRPGMSDLRESGQIEQDAHQIWFINRPEMYDPKAEKGEAELDIAKNRDGETGLALMKWDARMCRFSDRVDGFSDREPSRDWRNS